MLVQHAAQARHNPQTADDALLQGRSNSDRHHPWAGLFGKERICALRSEEQKHIAGRVSGSGMQIAHCAQYLHHVLQADTRDIIDS